MKKAEIKKALEDYRDAIVFLFTPMNSENKLGIDDLDRLYKTHASVGHAINDIAAKIRCRMQKKSCK